MTQNPYELPEGNVQISFSGGRTSAFMLHNILQANGNLPDRVKVLFQNTGRELPETIDFIQRCSIEWGLDVIWLEYDVAADGKPTFDVVSHADADMTGKPFDRLIDKYNALPRAGGRFCTGELKMDTARRYLKSIGWGKWHNCLGIRADEPSRVKPNKRKFITNWHPMFEAGHTNDDVMRFWSQQRFDLNLPIINGKTISGNCDFCFLKSEAALSYMYREFPSRAKWWIEAEKRTGRSFHPERPIGRLVDFIDRQGDWIFDDEDYLCQKSGGDCTG